MSLRALLLLATLGACTPSSDGATPAIESRGGKSDSLGAPNPIADGVDLRSTALEVDMARHHAKATITLTNPTSRRVTFEAEALNVTSVHAGTRAISHRTHDRQLQIELPTQASEQTVTIEYDFATYPEQAGWLEGGSTMAWPYFCGRLFPCHSDPSDGLHFELSVTGVPEGKTAIFPQQIGADAPSYMLAWAIGSYQCQSLGQTPSGTALRTCWLPRGKTKALAGTRHLRDIFAWYEDNLGPYLFGRDVAAVSVSSWGELAAGGLEHHPYWHVDAAWMGDELTQAHEAAHGWFGNGVRIQCWEDFVLSEGTVTYLAAVALGERLGQEYEDGIWAQYHDDMETAIATEDTIAWPDACGEVDIMKDGLFSNVVYMKGAFFYKALAEEIGEEDLLTVLSLFYQDHAGKAARMQDLMDAIHYASGFDPMPLANAWLRTKGAAPN